MVTIGFTLGDPCGIGPEVLLKALWAGKTESLYHPLLLGPPDLFEQAARLLDIPFKFRLLTPEQPRSRPDRPATLDVIEVGSSAGVDLFSGTISPAAARLAFQSIRVAVELALRNRIDAVVTAPINKEALHRGGFRYPGHTQILSSLTKSPRYAMMFVSPGIRVVLVTTHLALSEVPSAISRRKYLEKILLADEALREYFSVRNPQLAVLGLNPHAGEGGLFGREEKSLIAPAVRQAQKKGLEVAGPFPADSLFTPQNRKPYDAIIAMYHDQGLLPLKALYPGRTVNVTLGLPIIRTSPDHGTAFNIAGKGIADPQSMIEALHLAVQMARKRKRLD